MNFRAVPILALRSNGVQRLLFAELGCRSSSGWEASGYLAATLESPSVPGGYKPDGQSYCKLVIVNGSREGYLTRAVASERTLDAGRLSIYFSTYRGHGVKEDVGKIYNIKKSKKISLIDQLVRNMALILLIRTGMQMNVYPG